MADLVLQDLAQELQIKVPDAPLPYLTRVLRQAIQEFCEKSESYIFCFDGITAQANDPYYDIGLPSGTRISKVNRVSYDGVPLDATSEALLDADVPNWETEASTPSKYFFRQETLVVAPIPSSQSANAIKGAVVLKPTRAATKIDNAFFEENELAIMDGALRTLFQDTQQLWGDITLAGLHQQRFDMAIEGAKSKAQLDNTAKKRVMSYGG